MRPGDAPANDSANDSVNDPVDDLGDDLDASIPRRRTVRWQRGFDIGLVVILLLPMLLYAAAFQPGAAALTLGQILPLLWRRSRPVAVFAVVAGFSVLQWLMLDRPIWGQVAFPIATFAVARYTSARLSHVALGVGILGGIAAAVDWVGAAPQVPRPGAVMVLNAIVIGVIEVAAWALGSEGRVRRAYLQAQLEEQQRRVADAEQRAEVAAAEERARIAREMHDVIAHGLSVIVVQAEGARFAAAHDPNVAVRTLETIGETGRASLDQMRRLLGLLRGSSETGYAPQPGLADLPALLIGVESDLPDPLPSVPDDVALTVYRITQEALTNVRKHAGPDARASVRLRSVDDVLSLEVHDDGRGAAAPAGSGLGLLGMRERVELHGGELVAGPARTGGWDVTARIPR